MIILEEPYISQLLLDYLEESQIPVLSNNLSKHACLTHKLNVIEETEFIEVYNTAILPRLYTVSEYALDWVCTVLHDEKLVNQITLLKDKVAFRKVCSCIYEDLLFNKISYTDLFKFNISEVRLPVVLKPSVGFLSAGVYTITNPQDWEYALEDIRQNFLKLAATFPNTVVGDTCFILESYIHGREFAIDLYFNEKEPIIINIFEHPFTSKEDVSDRLYITNKTLFDDYLSIFTEHITRLNKVLNLSNIPIHMEVRVENGKIVPIEINPLRFAGLCLNEIHFYIAGKHPLSYFFSGTCPDHNTMWKGKESKTFSFSIIEKPKDSQNAALDIEKLKHEFSKIVEVRLVDNPKLGILAFIFSEAETSNKSEISNILNLDVTKLLNYK